MEKANKISESVESMDQRIRRDGDRCQPPTAKLREKDRPPPGSPNRKQVDRREQRQNTRHVCHDVTWIAHPAAFDGWLGLTRINRAAVTVRVDDTCGHGGSAGHVFARG